MTAGRDDDLRVLQVQVADAADVAVFCQLGLGGRGQGGVQSSDTVSPGEVGSNLITDEIGGIQHVEEEQETVGDWPLILPEEETLTDTAEDDRHSIKAHNSSKDKIEVILQFLGDWVFFGLVAVPGYDDVVGDVEQTLKSHQQADGEDSETPCAGDYCSSVEEVVDGGERQDEATDVDGEGRDMPVELGVGGRERVQEWSRDCRQTRQNEDRHNHWQEGDGASSLRQLQVEQGKADRIDEEKNITFELEEL